MLNHVQAFLACMQVNNVKQVSEHRNLRWQRNWKWKTRVNMVFLCSRGHVKAKRDGSVPISPDSCILCYNHVLIQGLKPCVHHLITITTMYFWMEGQDLGAWTLRRRKKRFFLIFLEQVFQNNRHLQTPAVTQEQSQLFCLWIRKKKSVYFICMKAKYINQTKQKHKAVVLQLHSSNNIISVHFSASQIAADVRVCGAEIHLIPHQTIMFRLTVLGFIVHERLNICSSQCVFFL